MIEIKPDCREQALNMVRTQATKVLEFDRQWTFYGLDGHAWMITSTGAVFRSDESVESDIILRLAKEVGGLYLAVKGMNALAEQQEQSTVPHPLNCLCLDCQTAILGT